MDRPATMNAWRISAITLVCIMLGACSTTQKSSTVTGSVEDEQVAAPVTEAGATPADASAPAPSTSESAPTTQAAEQALPEFPPTPIDSQDQVEARQQLAEQEAEITRLREEQAEARQAAADEAARLDQLDQPSTARSQASQSGAAPSTAAPSTAAPSTAAPSTGAPATSAAASTADGSDRPAIGQPLETSVYFDFDRTSVSEEYDAVVAANAAYLKANPNLRVTIQGNCDERGSREYNLALGQRRAEMVKRALELSGVDGGRIDTVSFGAEKPVAFGKDEESYRQNRRADIVY